MATPGTKEYALLLLQQGYEPNAYQRETDAYKWAYDQLEKAHDDQEADTSDTDNDGISDSDEDAGSETQIGGNLNPSYDQDEGSQEDQAEGDDNGEETSQDESANTEIGDNVPAWFATVIAALNNVKPAGTPTLPDVTPETVPNDWIEEVLSIVNTMLSRRDQGDTNVETGDTNVETGDTNVQTGDTHVTTGPTTVDASSGDTTYNAGDTIINEAPTHINFTPPDVNVKLPDINLTPNYNQGDTTVNVENNFDTKAIGEGLKTVASVLEAFLNGITNINALTEEIRKLGEQPGDTARRNAEAQFPGTTPWEQLGGQQPATREPAEDYRYHEERMTQRENALDRLNARHLAVIQASGQVGQELARQGRTIEDFGAWARLINDANTTGEALLSRVSGDGLDPTLTQEGQLQQLHMTKMEQDVVHSQAQIERWDQQTDNEAKLRDIHTLRLKIERGQLRVSQDSERKIERWVEQLGNAAEKLPAIINKLSSLPIKDQAKVAGFLLGLKAFTM